MMANATDMLREPGTTNAPGPATPETELAKPSSASKSQVRTCVGCAQRVDADAEPLVRLILGPDGQIAVDGAGGGFGRGAHLHPRSACIAGAAARGLQRAAKRAGLVVLSASAEAEPLSAASLASAIHDAMSRRLVGLMGSAVRAKAVFFGADAVTGGSHRGEARLVIVACDAAAAADLTEVRRAVAEGRAVAWGTKQTLAALCGKGRATGEGLALVAITSKPLATAIAESVRVIDACASAPQEARSTASRRGGRGSRPMASRDEGSAGQAEPQVEVLATRRGHGGDDRSAISDRLPEQRRRGRESGRAGGPAGLHDGRPQWGIVGGAKTPRARDKGRLPNG